MTKTKTSQKGKCFEKKVAMWAKNFFNPNKKYKVEVKTNELFQGKTAVRPYEIDVWLYIKRWPYNSNQIFFIECKNRASHIKRVDIDKFLASAKDIKRAVGFFNRTDERDWNGLIFVSTAEFDSDALRIAEQNKMGCYYYDGKRYIEKLPVIDAYETL